MARKTGLIALIGSGLLSLLHTLSHIIPAIGLIGLSTGSRYEPLYNFFSSEYMQLAYIPFVALSFWYMYKDHQHHKHEKELNAKIQRLEKELKSLRK